jgi:nucleoside-diphosphate-sugar epimerase
MTVAVVGASGYLGRYVTDELLNRGRDVVAFDIDPGEEMYDRASTDDGLAVVHGDMTAFADVSAMLSDYRVDELVQLAYFGVPTPGLMHAAEEHPYRASNTNVTGFNNVVEAASQFDLETVVCASSTVVYGPPEFYERFGIEVVDEESPNGPETVYGACKVMNEHIAETYREKYGINLACIRLPLIYGPDRYAGAAPFIVELFETAASGGEMTVDNGDTTYDLLYERDVGPLFAEALDAGTYDHTAYNVVGHTVTVRELVQLAEDYGQPDVEFTVEDADTADYPRVSDERFRDEFEYEPQYTAERAAEDYLTTLQSE